MHHYSLFCRYCCVLGGLRQRPTEGWSRAAVSCHRRSFVCSRCVWAVAAGQADDLHSSGASQLPQHCTTRPTLPSSILASRRLPVPGLVHDG